MCVYAPISYVLPSRLKKYEELYDTEVSGGRGKLTQQDRSRSCLKISLVGGALASVVSGQ
jgi:hypothetical protein